MPYNVNSVVTETFTFNDFIFTMNVTGPVTQADVGKAVTRDTSKPNAVKLAGDGDRIIGRLETLETGGLDGLTVGAIARKFRTNLPKTGAVAVGDVLIGAGGGSVKKNATAGATGPEVIEVRDTTVVAEYL